MVNIQVRKDIDELTFERWEFKLLDETDLVLTSYHLLKKENVQSRNYAMVKIYERLFNRRSNMTEEEVELPEDVKDKAIISFIQQIKVIKVSERYKI